MENSLECYDMYMRLLNEVPRRHWKTTGMNRVYVVRKLCETVFTKKDQNIINSGIYILLILTKELHINLKSNMN